MYIVQYRVYSVGKTFYMVLLYVHKPKISPQFNILYAYEKITKSN